MRSITTYISILRKKGLYTCLREVKKAVWPAWWTHSRAAIEQIQAERASRYLWRRYGKLITKPLNNEAQSNKSKKTIWICWLQGIEQAPEIVQRCIASAKKWAPDYNICLLTANNIADYVVLPEHIWTKYRKGTIPFTHFSDILRTALLVQHGGVWMDATVLLTNTLSDNITEQPLFFFQQSRLQKTPHAGSSWFIAAHKGHPVLQRVLDLLCAYWETENKLRDYYLFHLFLYLVLTRNQQGKDMLNAMPYIPNVDVHTLQFALFDDFNEARWQHLCSRSSVHKLTWKFNHNEPLQKQGTYYDYILHHLHI